MKVLLDGIDAFIVREMGNAGPPASKFFQEEMKDIVAKIFPPETAADEEEDEDDDGDSDGEDDE